VALHATGRRASAHGEIGIDCKAGVSFRIDNPSVSDGCHAPHSTSYPDDDIIGRSLVNKPSGGVISKARTARGTGWDAIHSDAVYA
jgi:hypothetical protein